MLNSVVRKVVSVDTRGTLLVKSVQLMEYADIADIFARLILRVKEVFEQSESVASEVGLRVNYFD